MGDYAEYEIDREMGFLHDRVRAPKKDIPCPLCPERFRYRKQRRKHLNVVHGKVYDRFGRMTDG